MPRFFVPPFTGEETSVTGEDGRHIARSLRMKTGDSLTLCDGEGTDYQCEITGFSGDEVWVRVLERLPSHSEPTVRVTVYQGIPKGDKMDAIVQKAVELGAAEIVPVAMRRCVSRPDEKSAVKKAARWQKIADEAAKQSGRGTLPKVLAPMGFSQAVERAFADGAVLLFYEGGGAPLREVICGETGHISFFIGPEGGVDDSEVALLTEKGAKTATLGPRILRTETAPLAALTAIMLLTGNLE